MLNNLFIIYNLLSISFGKILADSIPLGKCLRIPSDSKQSNIEYDGYKQIDKFYYNLCNLNETREQQIKWNKWSDSWNCTICSTYNKYSIIENTKKSAKNTYYETYKLYCKEACELNEKVGFEINEEVYSLVPIELEKEFSEWSQWSECKLKCTGGTRYRFRFCHYSNDGLISKQCHGELSQYEECKERPECQLKNKKNIQKLLSKHLEEINYNYIKHENQSIILKSNDSLYELITQYYPLAKLEWYYNEEKIDFESINSNLIRINNDLLIDTLKHSNTGLYYSKVNYDPYKKPSQLINLYTLVVLSNKPNKIIVLDSIDYTLECNHENLVNLLSLKQYEIEWFKNNLNFLFLNTSNITIDSSGVYYCQVTDLINKRVWLTNLVRLRIDYKFNRYVYDSYSKHKFFIIFFFIQIICFSLIVLKHIETKYFLLRKLAEAYMKDYNLKY